jgi:hypothetical protein
MGLVLGVAIENIETCIELIQILSNTYQVATPIRRIGPFKVSTTSLTTLCAPAPHECNLMFPHKATLRITPPLKLLHTARQNQYQTHEKTHATQSTNAIWGLKGGQNAVDIILKPAVPYSAASLASIFESCHLFTRPLHPLLPSHRHYQDPS